MNKNTFYASTLIFSSILLFSIIFCPGFAVEFKNDGKALKGLKKSDEKRVGETDLPAGIIFEDGIWIEDERYGHEGTNPESTGDENSITLTEKIFRELKLETIDAVKREDVEQIPEGDMHALGRALLLNEQTIRAFVRNEEKIEQNLKWHKRVVKECVNPKFVCSQDDIYYFSVGRAKKLEELLKITRNNFYDAEKMSRLIDARIKSEIKRIPNGGNSIVSFFEGEIREVERTEQELKAKRRELENQLKNLESAIKVYEKIIADFESAKQDGKSIDEKAYRGFKKELYDFAVKRGPLADELSNIKAKIEEISQYTLTLQRWSARYYYYFN